MFNIWVTGAYKNQKHMSTFNFAFKTINDTNCHTFRPINTAHKRRLMGLINLCKSLTDFHLIFNGTRKKVMRKSKISCPFHRHDIWPRRCQACVHGKIVTVRVLKC